MSLIYFNFESLISSPIKKQNEKVFWSFISGSYDVCQQISKRSVIGERHN